MAGRGRFETFNGITYEFTNGEELKGKGIGKYSFWYVRSSVDPTWRLASKKTLKEAKDRAEAASYRHKREQEQRKWQYNQKQQQNNNSHNNYQSGGSRNSYSSNNNPTSTKMLNVDLDKDYKFLVFAFHPDRFPEEYREVATEYLKRINGMRDLMRSGR